MGADAEVYLFDATVYREQIVPFFRKLILHGDMERAIDEKMDAIQPFMESIRAFLQRDDAGWKKAELKPTDLDAYCTYLGPNFSLLPMHYNAVDTSGKKWQHWEQRACVREDCPARSTCPFHISDRQNNQIETIAALFKSLVKVTCLGRSQFVGRSFNAFLYKDVLTKNNVSLDSQLWRLLFLLGGRGFVIGYQFANSDGIHGWLIADETTKLATLLDSLALPPLDISFEAMLKTRRLKQITPKLKGLVYEIEGWEWDELSLSFVKIVATLAARYGKGILWGNSISSRPIVPFQYPDD